MSKALSWNLGSREETGQTWSRSVKDANPGVTDVMEGSTRCSEDFIYPEVGGCQGRLPWGRDTRTPEDAKGCLDQQEKSIPGWGNTWEALRQKWAWCCQVIRRWPFVPSGPCGWELLKIMTKNWQGGGTGTVLASRNIMWTMYII